MWLADLRGKIKDYAGRVAALMIRIPPLMVSSRIHRGVCGSCTAGGKCTDGANMNAQVVYAPQ